MILSPGTISRYADDKDLASSEFSLSSERMSSIASSSSLAKENEISPPANGQLCRAHFPRCNCHSHEFEESKLD